jgi:hypothetical protein
MSSASAVNNPAGSISFASTSGSGVVVTGTGTTFVVGDVGKAIICNGAYAVIATYSSGTSVTANIVGTLSGTAAVNAAWALETPYTMYASLQFNGIRLLEVSGQILTNANLQLDVVDLSNVSVVPAIGGTTSYKHVSIKASAKIKYSDFVGSDLPGFVITGKDITVDEDIDLSSHNQLVQFISPAGFTGNSPSLNNNINYYVRVNGWRSFSSSVNGLRPRMLLLGGGSMSTSSGQRFRLYDSSNLYESTSDGAMEVESYTLSGEITPTAGALFTATTHVVPAAINTINWGVQSASSYITTTFTGATGIGIGLAGTATGNLTFGATSGSGVTLTNTVSTFTSRHIGIKILCNLGYAAITAVASGTSATVDITGTLSATTVSAGSWAWALGVVSAVTSATRFSAPSSSPTSDMLALMQSSSSQTLLVFPIGANFSGTGVIRVGIKLVRHEATN